jgi:hypothetical protein
MDNMKKKLLASITIIVFVLVGCGTPQSGNTYIVPQQINEPKIAEIIPLFETQIERVNNCDGTNPTYNVSYKTIEAQKATFEVSVGAGGLVTGTPIPSALEVQLEAKITAALAKDYGLTTEKNHDLTLDNVQGTFLEHTITWKVTRVKGLIEVIYGDGIAQVGFDKIANVELYNRTSNSLGCDGQSANVPPTSMVATQIPVATLQTEPLPTQSDSPFRKHEIASVGTGIFTQVTSSDGNAPYSQSELDTSHYRIYRIRPEENPDGCGVSVYNASKVWFSSSVNTVFTVNGQEVGKLSVSTGRHGFVADWNVKVGDKICAVGYAASGFHIIFGPDMYYHYDSYCYRGYC